MLDRTVAPGLNLPKFKGLESPYKSVLTNGVECAYFNAGEQEVIKIEIILSSGSSLMKNHAVANICMEMLREGTIRHTSTALNEILDYYGAFLDLKSGLDHSVITLYGRSTYIDILVPLLAEVLLTPKFDEQSLKKQKEKAIQNLKINQAKTSYWSPRLLRKSLFGEEHAYSRQVNVENIEDIDRNDIIQYHLKHLVPSLHSIIIAGSFEQGLLEKLIGEGFGSVKLNQDLKSVNRVISNIGTIEKRIEGANQSSIALGRLSMNSINTEYPIHSLLIKVFGGYFGSRLMKTLREDEGLTYGIHAHTMHLKSASYIQITSNIEQNSAEKGIKLIFDEMNTLTNDAVSDTELNTVKNYMLGEIVNSSNNVFDFAELYRKIVLQALPEDYYISFYNRVLGLNSNDILEYAQHTLIPKEFAIAKVS